MKLLENYQDDNNLIKKLHNKKTFVTHSKTVLMLILSFLDACLVIPTVKIIVKLSYILACFKMTVQHRKSIGTFLH